MAKARAIAGLHGAMSFEAAARATVAVRTQELFAQAEDVLDINDIERVHDMRVASRRLRAVLEIYACVFDHDVHAAVLRDVKRLADALGARRDPDVQLAALEDFAARAPAADRSGIEVFARRLRAEQAAGNETL